jgi:alpha-tubulin suppressor-like RCC1 family protein
VCRAMVKVSATTARWRHRGHVAVLVVVVAGVPGLFIACSAVLGLDNPIPPDLIADGSLLQDASDAKSAADSPGPSPDASMLAAVTAVASREHTCALRAGEVHCWGRNDGGELGVPSGPARTSAKDASRVPLPRPVSQITVTSLGSCALLESKEVYCWGREEEVGGTAGAPGTHEPRVLLTGVTQLRSGRQYVCAITEDSSLFCWGIMPGSFFGQDSPREERTPIALKVIAEGDSGNRPITDLALGWRHMCITQSVTKESGVESRVACFGNNERDQLGETKDLRRGQARAELPFKASSVRSDVAEIHAGRDFTCARHVDGQVSCWGANQTMQLGSDGPQNGRPVLNQAAATFAAEWLSVGESHACAGSAVSARCWGSNAFGQLGAMARTSSAPEIALDVPQGGRIFLGEGATFVSHMTGFFARGANAWGELGLGGRSLRDQLTRSISIMLPSEDDGRARLGAYNSFFYRESGAATLRALGDNLFGQRGPSSINGDEPNDVSGIQTTSAGIATGAAPFACAINAGRVLCWGSNADGGLGRPPTTMPKQASQPTLVQDLANRDVSEVALGRAHACALESAGDISCWGQNNKGQTKAGPADVLGTIKPGNGGSRFVRVFAASDYSCGLVARGSDRFLQCWGDVDATTAMRIGGDDWASRHWLDVSDVALGALHHCVRRNGSWKCFGPKGNPELHQPAFRFSDDGDAFSAKSVVAGDEATCRVVSAGGLECLGKNYDGQLGLPLTTRETASFLPVAGLPSSEVARHVVMARGALLVVTDQNRVYTAGRNTAGQLGYGPVDRDIDVLAPVPLR